ncbi:hypothetical protein MKX01_019168 [Papaver californicum]|nr:hypothetical protein MKX01_019168 [Papaver californicum]
MALTSKKKKHVESLPLESSDLPPPPTSSSPAAKGKRTKCPGVRKVGRKIYDSENGTTCHQCRQKTMEFVAACKNNSKPCTSAKKKNEPCNLKFCHKCLTNRYGEKAEEVKLLDGWHCPKCRGICNCSFCRKKRGDIPTGMLIHRAKATGYESVSQLLSLRGPERVVSLKKKSSSSTKELSKSRCGKENSQDGNIVPDLNEKPLESESDENTIQRSNCKISVETGQNNNFGGAIISSSKRINSESMQEGDIIPETKKSKTDETNADDSVINHAEFDTPFPQGVDLITIVGIALPSEDAGHALQFLEFCNAFEQVLDLKKGQPESILQELLTNGCSSSPGQCSLVIQMHIQLLSLIQKDTGEEYTCPSSEDNSWLQALDKCIAESNYALKEFPLTNCFQKDVDVYNKLELSQKLRLLNFLCDETLGTTTMRKWIDDEKDRCSERVREAREKVDAAKKKEDKLILKMRDEVAKSVIAENGDSVSTSEHEEHISKIQAEAANAHAEKLEAKRMVPKKNQRSHAYRTEPILSEGNGHTFWSLKGHSSRSIIMLQDVGSWDSDTPGDKWFSYDCEQRTAVENYISSVRKRRLRLQHEDANRDK